LTPMQHRRNHADTSLHTATAADGTNLH
jgi:hypothetical protein